MVLAAGLGLVAGPNSVGARGDNRTLTVHNVNTKETVTVTFKKNGAYDAEGMRQINHIMRDWRRNQATDMDPKLIDLIWEIHTELGSQKPVHLISGYRSASTNESLRRRGGGQARASRHILGKAADIHFPDVDVKQLRNSALIREVGGVGYYPGSRLAFVHVDTDQVRSWPRLPRQELAMLFPSGRTRHLPADGRPLTAEDGRIAMAKLRALGQAPVQVARAEPPRPAAPVQPQAPIQTARAELPAAKTLPSPPAAALPSPALPDRAPATARPMLASLTGPDIVPGLGGNRTATRSAGFGLSWLTRLDDIAGPPPPSGEQLHGAARAGTAVASGQAQALASYRRAAVAPAPEVDLEHPEELSYQPYSVLPLLATAAAAGAEDLLTLVHPDQDDTASRLLEAPVVVPVRFGQRLASDAFYSGRRFSGPAVVNVMASLGGHLPRSPIPTSVQ